MKIRCILGCLGVTILAAGISQAQEASNSVLSLMKSVVIPESNVIFAAGKAAPATDKAWAQMVQSAGRLTDAAKALATQAPSTNADSWARSSRIMIDAASRVGAAARQKNVDAVLDAGDLLYESCEACHRQHLKK
jgi:cytochrome c556